MATDTISPGTAVSRVRRRRDWRVGGRTVKPWDEIVLAIALVSLGGALLIAAAIRGFDAAPTSAVVADAVVLVGMVVAVVLALMRARPHPLLQLRAVDIVYGLGFGLILLLLQGWLTVAAGGSGALPSDLVTSSGGGVWMLVRVVVFALLAPLIEEVFLRGVLLVTAYSVMRRLAGRAAALVAALLTSGVASIVVHSWTAGVSWQAWLTPAVVSLVCGGLVLSTGRVWGAVFVHFVVNAALLGLAVVGMRWA